MKPSPSPKELVTHWIELFNAGDSSGLAALYAEDAVNHQVANEPVHGRAAIEAMFREEFANAEMVCLIEQLLSDDGEWGNGRFSNGRTLLGFAVVDFFMYSKGLSFFSAVTGINCPF